MVWSRRMLARAAGVAVWFVLMAASPASAQMAAWTDRGFLGASVGQQWMSQQVSTSGEFRIYDEDATWNAPFEVDDSFLVDVNAGYRVWKNLALGVGFTRTTDTHAAVLTASIPDVLEFERPHTSTAQITGLKREEQAFHVSAIWMVPITGRFDIALMAGPSFFTVKQPFATGITVTPGASTIATTSTGSLDRSATGFHVAADGTARILRNIGVGAMARWSAAKVDAPELAGGSLDAGGFQGTVGVRIRF